MSALHANRFGRTLALAVGGVAVFHTIAALSRPTVAGRPATALVALWLGVLLGHAAAYWGGPALRGRVGVAGYLVVQVALIATLGMTGALYPVGVALYAALTAEAIVLRGARWGATAITLGAILLFGATAIAASDLYRGATAGLLLALTGVVAHALVGLAERRTPQLATAVGAPTVGASTSPASEPVAPAQSSPPLPSGPPLTPREREVLEALARGARNGEIARTLGISERTVKAHLASIYQKLGVASRAAAVAAAFDRRLIARR